MRRAARVVTAVLLGSSLSVAVGQSSPNYRITNSSLVATAGSTSSPLYQATLVGGDGSPAQGASSPNYTVAIGPGDPSPAGADVVFASGFEPVLQGR